MGIKLIIRVSFFLMLFLFELLAGDSGKNGEDANANINKFFKGSTFHTCAETEIEMNISFFEDMKVKAVYRSYWWKKNKKEEFVIEQKGKYEILKNDIVRINMSDGSVTEFLFGHNVNWMVGSFPYDGLVFLKSSGGNKDSVFYSMQGETTFFYKKGCYFYYVDSVDSKTVQERKDLRRKYYLEKLENEQNQELKTLFISIMDNNVEAIKIQLKQNNELAGMLSYWEDTPLLFTVRYYTALQDLNLGINIDIIKVLLENGANPNQKETLTGLNNPAVTKMFSGWPEKTALSWIKKIKKLKNKDEVINLLKKCGAKE